MGTIILTLSQEEDLKHKDTASDDTMGRGCWRDSSNSGLDTCTWAEGFWGFVKPGREWFFLMSASRWVNFWSFNKY